MREDQPSLTAAWVALCRGLAPWLPDGGQLASDPFGLEFAPRSARPLLTLTARAPRLVRWLVSRGGMEQMMLWLQLRTRALDDDLLAFARAGGRQVVLLGAGFDCRASRLTREIDGGVVFEIDHPATQRKKREVLARLGAPSLRTEFVSWNFERQQTEDLPAHLVSIGHDPSCPTYTIWEGVTPYLTEPAIAATVAAVRSWSRAKGSRLGFTYLEPRTLRNPWRPIVSAFGEPWRFGWQPAQLPSWLAAHSMELVRDESDVELARRYLPANLSARLDVPGRHVALARPT
jgi:methyltransferase (TIGR00027 family)